MTETRGMIVSLGRQRTKWYHGICQECVRDSGEMGGPVTDGGTEKRL